MECAERVECVCFSTALGGNSYNEATKQRRLRIPRDQTEALQFLFVPGVNSSVMEIEMQPGGMFWVAGFFTKYGTTTVPSIIRLTPDGTLASVASTNLNNAQRLVSQEDGKLIASFYNILLSELTVSNAVPADGVRASPTSLAPRFSPTAKSFSAPTVRAMNMASTPGRISRSSNCMTPPLSIP